MSPDSAVLDASGAIRIITSELSKSEKIEDFSSIISPLIYWYEIGNICWKNLVFGQWNHVYIKKLLHQSNEITQLKEVSNQERIISVSKEYNISFYDGCYLDLCIQFDSTLISVDKKLNAAAQKAGIDTFF